MAPALAIDTMDLIGWFLVRPSLVIAVSGLLGFIVVMYSFDFPDDKSRKHFVVVYMCFFVALILASAIAP